MSSTPRAAHIYIYIYILLYLLKRTTIEIEKIHILNAFSPI